MSQILVATANRLQLLAGDSFVRANGALGANWTAEFGLASPTIVSNAVQNTPTPNGGAAALYTGTVFPADQWASIGLVTINTDSAKYVGVKLRGATVTATNSYSCYVLGPLGATSVLHISKLNVGSFTDLASVTITSAANDIILATIQGTVINVYQNNVFRLTATDATIATGNPGILIGTGPTAADAAGNNFNAGMVQ